MIRNHTSAQVYLQNNIPAATCMAAILGPRLCLDRGYITAAMRSISTRKSGFISFASIVVLTCACTWEDQSIRCTAKEHIRLQTSIA